MKAHVRFLSLGLLLIVAGSCRWPTPATIATPAVAPTPTEHVTPEPETFAVRAVMDANGNGLLDPTDPPLEGARCELRTSRGDYIEFTSPMICFTGWRKTRSLE